jgi:hypothetical protein
VNTWQWVVYWHDKPQSHQPQHSEQRYVKGLYGTEDEARAVLREVRRLSGWILSGGAFEVSVPPTQPDQPLLALCLHDSESSVYECLSLHPDLPSVHDYLNQASVRYPEGVSLTLCALVTGPPGQFEANLGAARERLAE